MKRDILKEAVDKLDNNPKVSIAEVARDVGVSRPNLTMFYNGYNYGKEFAGSLDDSIADTLGRREINILKNQHKNNLKIREFNKDIKQQAFYEMFVDEYVLPEIKPLKKQKLKVIEDTDGIIEVYIGDIHYIDQERSANDISNTFKKIGQLASGKGTVKLHIVGDLIENTHHRQQQLTKKTKVMNQIIEVSQLLSEGILHYLIKEGQQVILNVYNGNHDEIRQLGVKSREDNESVGDIVLTMINAYLSLFRDTEFFNIGEAIEEMWTEDTHIQHGHFAGANFMQHMLTRKEQDKRFKDTKYFIKFHSHKYTHEVKKGTDLHFISAPCVKTWVSRWEQDHNQIGTNGILVRENGVFRFEEVN